MKHDEIIARIVTEAWILLAQETTQIENLPASRIDEIVEWFGRTWLELRGLTFAKFMLLATSDALEQDSWSTLECRTPAMIALIERLRAEANCLEVVRAS